MERALLSLTRTGTFQASFDHSVKLFPGVWLESQAAEKEQSRNGGHPDAQQELSGLNVTQICVGAKVNAVLTVRYSVRTERQGWKPPEVFLQLRGWGSTAAARTDRDTQLPWYNKILRKKGPTT